MTAGQTRVRRLARLAALARAEMAQAEQGLARAAHGWTEAAARRAALERFLAETRPAVGAVGAEALLAGARLRHLLAPAAEAACAEQESARLARGAAEIRLRAAAARAESLAERLGAARRQLVADAERRMTDLTPRTRTRR